MKQLAKAMVWFTSGSFIGTLTQIAKGKLSAVVLGPEGVGALSQLTNAWSLVNSISGLSFYNGVVRRIAKAKADDDTQGLLRQLSTSLLFLTGFSCAVTVVTTLLSSPLSHLIFDDNGARSGLVALALLSIPFSVTAQVYQGLLSGSQLVRPIVIAQVLSDLVSLLLFAVLMIRYGLPGAVVGFSSLHVAKLMFQIVMVRRALGAQFILPLARNFMWPEVRINLGDGFHGLVMSGLSIGTFLLLSRWVISDLGLDANGVFSVAWRVGGLYLGALCAAAGSYYFPSLAACKDDEELALRINEAVTLYLFLLPPVVVALIVGGELLVRILFSVQFVAAGGLMAIMLPGDLFRVVAETIGLSFLARRKLVVYTSSYVLWAASFLLGVKLLVPSQGLMGVAYAYLTSQVLNAVVIAFHASRAFSFQLSQQSVRAALAGLSASFAAVVAALLVPEWELRYPIGVAVILAWIAFSWRDESFRSLLVSVQQRISRLRS